MKQKEPPFDFEQAMQRLETIIQQFDDGSLTLDEMEARFVEGMQLLNQCTQRLEAVDQRVTRLIQDQNRQWKEVAIETEWDEPEENP